MQAGNPSVLMIGCFDTKEEDFAFLYDCLSSLGLKVYTLNLGIYREASTFETTVRAEEVAKAADTAIEILKEKGDRNLVVDKMSSGASKIAKQLLEDIGFQSAIGMGGGGGTYMVLKAMQSLPIGMPKLCLSTVATKDLSRQVGARDVTLMPSLVDIAGLNQISRMQINQAAGALKGMLNVSLQLPKDKERSIAISMFGNTTPCVEQCSKILREKGFEPIAFHAVGSGGRTMESLIAEGFFEGVLDITTTELADELCDGICSAGPDRLKAAATHGVPQIVVPGCIDMVNYGHVDTVPDRFRDRLLFSWAPDVTLMRTNEEENEVLGRTIAQRINETKGRAKVLLPGRGISIISAKNESFYHPAADQALFDSIKRHLHPAIELIEVDAHINDELFATKLVEQLLEIIE